MVTDTDFVVNDLGRRIYVDAPDPRSEALRSAGGDLNPHSLQLWRDLLVSDRWDLVVDVGANYGEMLLGVDLPRLATVIAFEPNDVVASHLSRSLREASLAVEVRRQALSDQVGAASFVVDAAWSGKSRLMSKDEAKDPHRSPPMRRVPTTTLDEAIGLLGARRACIKIDVEGAEDSVLHGGQHVLSRLQDVAIQIEILHRTPEQIASWTDIWRVYLHDVRTRALIRVDGSRVEQIAELLDLPWIYRQDAVLRRIKQP